MSSHEVMSGKTRERVTTEPEPNGLPVDLADTLAAFDEISSEDDHIFGATVPDGHYMQV